LDTNVKKQTTLSRMSSGQTGTVVQIAGGYGLGRRLQALGIRPGKRITKVSSMFGHGPVTVQVDSMQIAIGFGMAGKIIVEIDKSNTR
jgi:ferrous iron transport protein A